MIRPPTTRALETKPPATPHAAPPEPPAPPRHAERVPTEVELLDCSHPTRLDTRRPSLLRTCRTLGWHDARREPAQ